MKREASTWIIPTVIGHQTIDTGTGGLGNKRIREHQPNYSIVEIGQNTEQSPGNLRRLAVSQTPMKDNQLTNRSPNPHQKTRPSDN